VPLWPTFLGVVSWFGAQGVTAQRVAGSVVGITGVVLIALCGRKLAGDRAGLIAGAIAAVYPQLWINDGMLLSETIAVPMVALTILLAYRLRDRPTYAAAALLGGAIALTALSRSELILLYAFLCLPLVLGIRSASMKRRIQLLATIGGVGLLVLGPWIAYNQARFQDPVYLSTGIGGALSAGSCDEVFYGNRIGYYSNCFPGPMPPLTLDESQRDRFAYDYAKEYIRDHQRRIPVVAAARVGRLWDVFKPGQTTFLDWSLEGRGRVASWTGLYMFYALVPLGVLGLVALRRRRFALSPLLAPALIVTAAAATTFGVTRYRAPVEPALVIAAAVGIDALWRRLRRAQHQPVAPEEQPASVATARDVSLVDSTP
jgi:4-amino-4-deoxy-L-arabinose transferase-like glycosyltransferase